MRALILVAVLAVALPALAAEDAVPAKEGASATEAAATEEVTPTPEPTQGETAQAVEPEAAEAEPVEAVPAPSPVSADAVARATFTTAVDHREPVDSITSLDNDQSRVFYFTELRGISGREVTHRWEYNGRVVAEVPISIGGPRWRAYSSKKLGGGQLGEWTVSVVDDSGAVVRKDSFVYEEAPPEPEIAAPTETPAAEEIAAPAAPAAGEATDPAPASPAPAQP